MSTRPPGFTTRTIFLTPFGMSGNSITPNCDPKAECLALTDSAREKLIALSFITPLIFYTWMGAISLKLLLSQERLL